MEADSGIHMMVMKIHMVTNMMFILVENHASEENVYDCKNVSKIANKDKGKLLNREFVVEVIQSNHNKTNNKKYPWHGFV